MSILAVANDAETTDSPFALTGTMARSATNKINGSLSFRGGDSTAKDGLASYTRTEFGDGLVKDGSARGLRLQGVYQFKLVTAPTGGSIFSLRMGVTGGSDTVDIQVKTGTSVLTLVQATNSLAGTTALGTTAHQIEFDYRNDMIANGGAGRAWFRVFLDGNYTTPEIEVRDNANWSFGDGIQNAVLFGVSAAGKCTWQAIWDDFYIWYAHDPTSQVIIS